MKSLLVALLTLGAVGSSMAVDRADLDFRLRKLAMKFEAMQAKPDKRVPAQNLRNAQGIILLDRTKAGFLFAYQGGSGVVMVRDAGTGHWSAPAFLSANEASLGFQIGGQQSFIVILLMNTNAIRRLAEGSFDFGGEAAGTAGNSAAGVSGSVSSNEPLTLIYSDKEGLYGGVSIKGDSLSPDTSADVTYYGQYLTAPEILFEHKVKPTLQAGELAQKIDQYVK